VDRPQLEHLLQLARQHLAIPVNGAAPDLWLWEHSQRVMALTGLVARLPEIGGQPDVDALVAAALFHDAGWVIEFHQGRYRPHQMLGRPTSDLQRELAAGLFAEEIGNLLPQGTAYLAAEAIRHCNDRGDPPLEARVLAEAEALDEVGTLYLLRQFRQYQAEGRPVQQLVQSWKRQEEFRFWELRLSGGFRYTATRELARARLAAVGAFIAALERDLNGDDLRHLLPAESASTLPES
jgi:hypothetical protein